MWQGIWTCFDCKFRLLQVCFKRNVHGRTLEDIEAALQQWEPAPPSYPQLDPTSLLRPSTKLQVLSLCSPVLTVLTAAVFLRVILGPTSMQK